MNILYRKEGDEYVAAYKEQIHECLLGCGEVHYPYARIVPLVEPPCRCLESESNPHDYVLGHRQP